ncbi:MAG: hypothetical protein PHN72_05375 [Bacilli bacterium]|nr:hypothetical protein [Bacilli bacterium]
MKSKLNYLIGVSLKRKIKTKWFFIANALIALIVVAALNIDSIVTFFGGDFSEKKTIYVVDDTKESYDIFKSLVEAPSMIDKEESSYIVKKYDKSTKEASKKLEEKEEKDNIVVHFQNDETNIMKINITTKSFLETSDYTALYTALQNTKVAVAEGKSQISKAELAKIYSQVEIDRTVLDKDKKSEEENMNMVMSTLFPVLILPFFILTIFLVQMIGAEVNDEKTTRGMEIIISNVSPKTHFFSKILAGNIFVVMQGLLLFLYSGLGLFVRSLIGKSDLASGAFDSVGDMVKNILSSGVGDKLVYIIPCALLLMLCTFVAYSLLAGILASMTTTIEDFQQLQTPIMIVSLIGYYLAMMAGIFNGALFIKVAAFIPFISAILAPSLLMLGQFSFIEMIIAIVLTLVTNFLLIKYGLKIYKVGILNYSSNGLWKKMFKALKD